MIGPRPGKLFGNKARIIAVSPDQSLVAAVSGAIVGIVDPVHLYDAGSLKLTGILSEGMQPPTVGILCLDFAPDSKFLAVGKGDGSVVVYDLFNGKAVASIDAFKTRYQLPVAAIAISPDGQFVVVSTGLAGSYLRHSDGSPSRDGQGKFMALRVPDPVRVFCISDGELVASKLEHLEPVYYLSWRGRQDLIAFISFGDQLHLWNPWRPNSQDRIIQLAPYASSVALSPDGSRVAVGARNSLLLYQFIDQR